LKKRYFLTVGYMILIFALSSLQNPPQPDINVPFIDKWEHMIEYAILGFLISYSVSSRKKTILSILAGIIIGTIYGLSDEFHQLFVPNRHFDLLDLSADSFGTMIGALLFLLFDRLRKRFEKSNGKL
jgi:VanZ family protein